MRSWRTFAMRAPGRPRLDSLSFADSGPTRLIGAGVASLPGQALATAGVSHIRAHKMGKDRKW